MHVHVIHAHAHAHAHAHVHVHVIHAHAHACACHVHAHVTSWTMLRRNIGMRMVVRMCMPYTCRTHAVHMPCRCHATRHAGGHAQRGAPGAPAKGGRPLHLQCVSGKIGAFSVKGHPNLLSRSFVGLFKVTQRRRARWMALVTVKPSYVSSTCEIWPYAYPHTYVQLRMSLSTNRATH